MNIDILREKMASHVPGVVGKQKEYAVMLLLVEKDGELHLLFEKRTSHIIQPGDVCFPGGKIDDGETVLECALRETEEEIGIAEENIEVLGRFDSILEVSRVRIHTGVGIVKKEALENLTLSHCEVDEVFTVPLKFFIDASPIVFEGKVYQDTEGFPYTESGIRSDYTWRVGHQKIYIYHWEDYIIWGLTAEISKWFADYIYGRLELPVLK